MSRALRLAWRLLAIIAATVWITALAACGTMPDRYRACLIYGDKKFHTGTVIEKRQDGARYFRFDDPTAGDNGYRWVTENDSVDIRPCEAANAVNIGAADAMYGGTPAGVPTP